MWLENLATIILLLAIGLAVAGFIDSIINSERKD